MMALGLTVQMHAGFGWAALAWQLALGTLAGATFMSWRRLRTLALPQDALAQRMRNLTIGAGLCGACWALGLVGWMYRTQPQWTLMAAGLSLIYTLHAVATGRLFPMAVAAFAAPVLAGCALVCAWALQPREAGIAITLIILHSVAAWRLLRKNWLHFTDSVELDVERSRLDGMLHEQKDMAENAVQLKTRFLASASHDLRQPMHAISLYLDGLAEVELPEHARIAISDARVCAHDMNDMFRSLLDISRLDAHQAVPSLSTFSLGPLISRVEKEFLPLAASRSVRLKVRPCADHVYSDPVMVERIALNFVSNAVRHTPAGGRVLVACRARGRALRFAVYDTGKGIPEAQQQVIFEEFHRLDTSQPHDNSGGLGLGLAIVRRLSQALRLPVIVRSKSGRGSMFAVDLPLVHVARPGAAAPIGGSGLSGRLIVVVDDEPSILQAVSFVLRAAGCDVVTAGNGSEAMQRLSGSARVPDIIICDYELNDARNGAQVVQDLREEFNTEIPALLVTGNTAGGKAEGFARKLGIAVLHKPLEGAILRSSLENLLATEER